MFGDRKDRLRELNLVLSEWDENRDYGAELTFEKVMIKNFPEMMKDKNLQRNHNVYQMGWILKNESIIMHLPLKF